MSDGPRHSVSVAAVVVDDEDRVLVVQRRDNGEWQIPGGVLELGESVHAGLVREVQEETGLIVEPERLTGVYKHSILGVVALVFRARKTGGIARPTDESRAVDWWRADRVRSEMGEPFAVRVLDGLKSGIPMVRIHDGVRLIRED